MTATDDGNAVISIHALREEGDKCGIILIEDKPKFLSTPSARRATQRNHLPASHHPISIHALREEGDLTRSSVPSGAR